MKTWNNALIVINKLVEGQPQRIHDGGILLALSSWHLYPDMSVFEIEPHKVLQNDALVAQGGMISLGLQNNREGADDGVWWSLPLAHMRYYGEPIVSTRNTGVGTAKITFQQFLFVALGSVLSTWDVSEHNFEPALTVMTHLGDDFDILTNGKTQWKVRRQAKWLQALSSASQTFNSLPVGDREEHRRLITFGMRRCSNLLGESQKGLCPVFGLSNISLMLEHMVNMEDKINLLRQWAIHCSPKLDSAVIRFRSGGLYSNFHYTNLFPIQQSRPKRKRHAKGPQHSEIYHTWVDPEKVGQEGTILDPHILETPLETADGTFSRRIPGGDIEVPFRHTLLRNESEWCEDKSGNHITKTHELFFGDPSIIAIFRPKNEKKSPKYIRNYMEVSHILIMAGIGTISYSTLASALLDVILQNKKLDEYFDCLDNLQHANTLYTHLPQAQVNLQVASRALNKWYWATSFEERNDKSDGLDLASCLSCIASFETGYLDLDPGKLQEAFAVSHENSIYVASPMLADPCENILPYPVRRIIGNIGEPGFAVLTAPQNIKIRPLGFDKWNFIAHRPFNGHLEDNFTATSLHLVMTGYKQGLNTGNHGSKDHEATFIEAIISVYDRGDWVADLDVMKAYRQWNDSIIRTDARCGHSEAERQNASIFPSLTCIDTWVELLDPPSGYSLVQARGNRLARLAAATIATEKGYQFRIIPAIACWSCIFEIHRSNRRSASPPSQGSDIDPSVPGGPPSPGTYNNDQDILSSELSHDGDDSHQGDSSDSSSLDLSDEEMPVRSLSPSRPLSLHISPNLTLIC